jgi:cytochrome c-type biogenesis protein CcmF
MIQEKKGMLKVWNLSLIILTFALCIFGTFLTRSGVVSSVHSFAGSSLGPLFVIFLVLVLGLSLGLLLYRLPRLSSEHRLDGLLSRESSFLFNNLILVGLAFTVLWGTMFPIISEWLAGTKMSVGPPFFNRVSLPIGLALLVLTGICPLIAWRRATLANFRRNLMLPLGAGALGATVLVAAGVHQPAAVGFFAGGIFVVWSIGAEFLRGARARQSISGEPFPLAFSRLVGRNKRRYGGFVVHVGMVVMLVGIVGSSVFQRELDVTLKPGESASLGSYSFVFRGLQELEHTDRAIVRADVGVSRDGGSLTTLQPEKHFHRTHEQPMTEADVQSGWLHDLYAVLAGWEQDGSARLLLYINPMMTWIWYGGGVALIGTLFAMLPDSRRRRQARAARDETSEARRVA